VGLGWLLIMLAGCAGDGSGMNRALRPEQTVAQESFSTAKFYQVHCPDQLEIQLQGLHPWRGRCDVAPDGRIGLGRLGTVRVDGLTPGEIADQLSQLLSMRSEEVQVVVAAYKSQQVYLYGEVASSQRAVAYEGPERVVELLERVGGLTSGASPGDVQVVRTHVADGKQPEIFHVDLPAIVLKQDQQSNIRLHPFDQIYIGQTKQSCMVKCLPPWCRGFFEYLCGMKSQSYNKLLLTTVHQPLP
jgi:protein involved in polysaccharide export with SLBB domain